jgi:hypothetical protein
MTVYPTCLPLKTTLRENTDQAKSCLLQQKLQRSVPQFFSIYIRGDHKMRLLQLMSDIMKAVDFSTLKNMLGK